jgi:ubiquinone/menaquinone biosynthesis C-methylase UbiE
MTAQHTHQSLVNAHFESTSDFWSDVYRCEGLYATLYRQRRDSVLSLIGELRIPSGSRVLEIGCGGGLTTVALAERGYAVDAVDTVGRMIDSTRQLAEKAGVGDRVRAQAGDVHALNFPDGLFHLVIVVGVMEWVRSLREPLFEIERVLAPGGQCIINVDNSWALHRFLDPMLNPIVAPLKHVAIRALESLGLRQRKARPGVHSIRQFDRALEAAGLHKQRGITLGFGPFTFLVWNLLSERVGVRLHWALQSLAQQGAPFWRSVGHVYLVVARKTAR